MVDIYRLLCAPWLAVYLGSGCAATRSSRRNEAQSDSIAFVGVFDISANSKAVGAAAVEAERRPHVCPLCSFYV
ncbi:hypothetical protein DFH06DRAFT_1158142 [Mycena polygramma]|nr:hypothetical protein DFH06DRAFT_1158142 [Mycena polygramma]